MQVRPRMVTIFSRASTGRLRSIIVSTRTTWALPVVARATTVSRTTATLGAFRADYLRLFGNLAMTEQH